MEEQQEEQLEQADYQFALHQREYDARRAEQLFSNVATSKLCSTQVFRLHLANIHADTANRCNKQAFDYENKRW